MEKMKYNPWEVGGGDDLLNNPWSPLVPNRFVVGEKMVIFHPIYLSRNVYSISYHIVRAPTPLYAIIIRITLGNYIATPHRFNNDDEWEPIIEWDKKNRVRFLTFLIHLPPREGGRQTSDRWRVGWWIRATRWLVWIHEILRRLGSMLISSPGGNSWINSESR